MKIRMMMILCIFLAVSILSACSADGGNASVEGSQPKDESLASENEPLSEDIDADYCNLILGYLKDREFKSLAPFVSKTEGVTFSPYYYTYLNDVKFTPAELQELKPTDEFVWGKYGRDVYSNAGDPIDLSVDEYFERFVYDKDYLQINPDGVSMYFVVYFFSGTNGIRYAPDTILFPGTDEDVDLDNYKGSDWSSLSLQFMEEDGKWMLVGVTHDGF